MAEAEASTFEYSGIAATESCVERPVLPDRGTYLRQRLPLPGLSGESVFGEILVGKRYASICRNTVMEDDFDIQLFISEVRKYPEIWNTSSRDYQDKNKKRAAWVNISEVFSPDFSERTEEEKNDISKIFMAKWKNIKDSFAKNLRRKTQSPHTARSGRPYVYAHQLSFLLQDEEDTSTHPSLYVENTLSETTLSENSETDKEDIPISEPHPVKTEPSANCKNDLKPSLPTCIPAPALTNEFDEDKAFFDSLIPTVKLFDVDQKLEFRSEVLNLVKKIRSSASHPKKRLKKN